MEEGKGTLQDWRSTQERKRSCWRARRGCQKGGNEITVNTAVTMTGWLLQETRRSRSVLYLSCTLIVER